MRINSRVVYLVLCISAIVFLSPINQALAQKKTSKSAKVKGTPYDFTQELDLLYRVDLMPQYRPNCVVEHKSTADPTGGNDDGFSGKYSFLREESGEKVLAELVGPGVINKIHSSAPTMDTLRFYFDSETTPRLKICFMDLFTGNVYPFVKPLSGNEVGGYYTYFPIPYGKSCKITFDGPRVQFYQIQYRNLPGYGVTSYNGKMTPAQEASFKKASQAWDNAKHSKVADFAFGSSSDYTVSEESYTLVPGKEIELFTKESGGRIVGIEIDGGNSFEGLNKDVILAAKWDAEPVEAIYAPLADFFGYAYGEASMRSMIIGSRDYMNYSYIPMPFDTRADVRLIYKQREGVKQYPIQFTAKIYYNDIPRDRTTEGKFYTSWRRERPHEGDFYKFAKLEGKGHYVGTVLSAQGLIPGMTEFYEGDDSTCVDGKLTIRGIGSEDYTNGGWYAVLDRWDRGISMPIHGCLDYSLPMSRTGGYRFFLNDKLSFEKDFYSGIEHGPVGCKYPVDYTSVAYYYCSQPQATPIMMPDEDLCKVYMPTSHMWFAQMMDISLGGGVKADIKRGLHFTTDKEGFVKISLEGVPEGRYKVLLNYYQKPKGAQFSVWQRQNKITDWQSSHADSEVFKNREYIGDIYLTNQTNSLSFHMRKDGDGDEFELTNITLELIP